MLVVLCFCLCVRSWLCVCCVEVFSYYRMCSLTIECVLLLQNGFVCVVLRRHARVFVCERARARERVSAAEGEGGRAGDGGGERRRKG